MEKPKKKYYKIYDKQYPSLLKYPFKSKFKYFQQYIGSTNPNIVKEPFVQDFKLKDAKKLSKPNFSNEPGCWEADLMFTNTYYDTVDKKTKNKGYLVMININTRYLVVEPIEGKSYEDLITPFAKIIESQLDYDSSVKTIKCDGERGFKSIQTEIIVLNFKDTNRVISNVSQLVNYNFHNKTSKVKEYIINNIINNPKYGKGYISSILTTIGYKITPNKVFDENTEFDYYPIKFVVSDSKYALSHKTVDAVIRTLKNAFGMDDRRLGDNNLMQQMVNYYNNTPHTGLRMKNYDYQDIDMEDYIGSGVLAPKQPKWIYYTPTQMQNDIDLEWQYIRMMRNKLQTIKEKQCLKGLLRYKRGNIILVHLDRGKTNIKHEKRRRVFNEIAEFLSYNNGNVLCKLLKPYNNETALIEVPIIYTKFVCSSISNLNQDYIKYFGL